MSTIVQTEIVLNDTSTIATASDSSILDLVVPKVNDEQNPVTIKTNAVDAIEAKVQKFFFVFVCFILILGPKILFSIL